MSQRYTYPSHGAHSGARYGPGDSAIGQKRRRRSQGGRKGRKCYQPASCVEQTVPSANDLLLFMSEYPGGPSHSSPLVSGPRFQHTLPSWYYSDPRGHIRRGCPVMWPGWARLRSQIRRPRFNHFLSCPRGRAGGSELEHWPIRAEERPGGIPLIFPRKAAGAQRDEVTCPESHNCLEMYDPTEQLLPTLIQK